MADWLERFARLATLTDRVSTLSDGVKKLAGKVENHNERIVRLETIIEIARPDGTTLRIAPSKSE
jgi:X-X-X-Leu-X-X-Gly heptad repeat protein